ncbi:MAG TPA: asparagine synthase (glutamine-hydrolyzing) [Longimicrobium sp.]|nr:asparagine synthase (glutamine-hydrolyzing) [Longimicrobium sp.]
MCGISAIAEWAGPGVPLADLRAMAQAQAHRGPDGRGFVVWRADGTHDEWRGRPGDTPRLPPGAFRLGLGHNLLAIQDPTPGALQPMRRPGGRLCISFNGEIYNFPELRAGLAARGAVFRTATDTEVLLALWEELGPAALERLRGMFAFALYDEAADTLWLARDRLGIKPLYYALLPGGAGIVAASELRGIHASGRVPRAWNPDALRAFLAAGVNQPGEDDTFFAGVRELPAGCLLRVRPGETEQRAWYRLPDAGACTVTAADLPALRDGFRENVRLHLRSSREVGVCLSGGLDSANLAFAAAEELGARASLLRTFTIGAAGSVDAGLADQAARAMGVRRDLLPSPAALALDDLAEMVVAIESPNHMWGPVNQFMLLRHVGVDHGVRVLLNGQGGDEALSGYPWFMPGIERFVGARFGAAQGRALGDAYRARAVFAPGQLAAMQRLYTHRGAWLASFDGGAAAALGVAHAEVAGWEPVRWFLDDAAEWPALRRGQLLRRELRHCLRHEDRLGMWHSIESRVPFADHTLVETYGDADPRFLYHDGWAKYPLRVLFPGLHPGVRWDTRKAGYWENHSALPRLDLRARDAVRAADGLGGLVPDPDRLVGMPAPAAWRFLQAALLTAGGDAPAARAWLEGTRAPARAEPALALVP